MQFLQRALRVAIGARGHAEPNPTVGCVIVRNNVILGEGHTSGKGGPHAEPNALDNARDPRGATAYVTLEPCCYTGHGKRTPPCVPRLISAGIKRVVIGCIDPFPHVAGEGIRQLREAGIEVIVGVCEAQARQLIAPFIARIVHRRPYVTLKWAISRDNKVAGRQGRAVQISNLAATAAVHALRGRCDAIAIGTNTLVNDDPRLTARTPNPPRRPMRVIFSNTLRFPPNRRVFDLGDGPTVVYTTSHADQAMSVHLHDVGVEVIELPRHDNGREDTRFSMSDAFADLARRDVTHLLIEPGPKLAGELISRGQVDRIWEIRGQTTIGDEGLNAPINPHPPVGTLDLDGDVLVESLNPQSDVYFGAYESADFLLI